MKCQGRVLEISFAKGVNKCSYTLKLVFVKVSEKFSSPVSVFHDRSLLVFPGFRSTIMYKRMLIVIFLLCVQLSFLVPVSSPCIRCRLWRFRTLKVRPKISLLADHNHRLNSHSLVIQVVCRRFHKVPHFLQSVLA